MNIRIADALAAIGLLVAGLAAAAGARSERVAPASPEGAPVATERDETTRQAARLLLALATAREHPCAPTDPSCQPPPTDYELSVTATARQALISLPEGFRDDCSGYVSAVYSRTGVPMDGNVRSLWDLAVEHDTLHWDPVPRPGDLVFWDNTTDRDHDGRWNDELTHIGLVLDVEPDATIAIAHGGTGRGRTLTRMNLLRPDAHEDEQGGELNGYLRTPSPADPPEAVYLTGQLWVAFAHVDPALDWLHEVEVDEW